MKRHMMSHSTGRTATACALLVLLSGQAPARRSKVSLTPQLVVVQDTYAMRKPAGDQQGTPPASAVDLRFILKNTGKKTCEVPSVGSDDCWLDLKLEGPGAVFHKHTGPAPKEHRSGSPVKLTHSGIKPYEIRIRDLRTGNRFLDYWYWTKPGTYTLTVNYTMNGKVYKTAPVTLQVTEPSEAALKCLDMLESKLPADQTKGIETARKMKCRDYVQLMDILRSEGKKELADKITPPVGSPGFLDLFSSRPAKKYYQPLDKADGPYQLHFYGKNEVTLRDAQLATEYYKVGTIYFYGTPCSPEALEYFLMRFRGLGSIYFWKTPFSREELELLIKHDPGIQRLSVDVSELPLADLKRFSELSGLKGLSLDASQGGYVTKELYDALQPVRSLIKSYNLKILKTIDYGVTKKPLARGPITTEAEWEALWKQQGKPAPDVDFKTCLVLIDQKDSNDPNRKNVSAVYSGGEYGLSISTTLIGFQPSGEFKTTCYVVPCLEDAGAT